jgi:hypothetical protein
MKIWNIWAVSHAQMHQGMLNLPYKSEHFKIQIKTNTHMRNLENLDHKLKILRSKSDILRFHWEIWNSDTASHEYMKYLSNLACSIALRNRKLTIQMLFFSKNKYIMSLCEKCKISNTNLRYFRRNLKFQNKIWHISKNVQNVSNCEQIHNFAQYSEISRQNTSIRAKHINHVRFQ